MVAAKSVALIGGMGPEAGMDVLDRFLRCCRQEMRQRALEICDQNYPPHLLIQHPIPDRTAALLAAGKDPLPALLRAFEQAQVIDPVVYGMACNTAHYWYGALKAQRPHLEVLHIAQETARTLHAHGVRTCLVMGTQATLYRRLYTPFLHAQGLEEQCLTAEEQATLHAAIYAIKQGERAQSTQTIRALLEQSLQQVDAVVLGCTELGLVIDVEAFPDRVVDAADALASALAQRAYGG